MSQRSVHGSACTVGSGTIGCRKMCLGHRECAGLRPPNTVTSTMGWVPTTRSVVAGCFTGADEQHRASHRDVLEADRAEVYEHRQDTYRDSAPT